MSISQRAPSSRSSPRCRTAPSSRSPSSGARGWSDCRWPSGARPLLEEVIAGARARAADAGRDTASGRYAATARSSTGPKRYTMVHLTQTTQWVACNSLHSLEERLARWLLASADATGSEHFELTQDFIAQMLGVRRPSVTVIVRCFEKEGMVQTSRGRIRISNRAALEGAVCEYYGFVRRQIDSAIPFEPSRSCGPRPHADPTGQTVATSASRTRPSSRRRRSSSVRYTSPFSLRNCLAFPPWPSRSPL